MHSIVRRTTLIVRDAGGSLRFHRDALGMTVWSDDEIVLGGVVFVMQTDDAQFLGGHRKWHGRVPAC